MGCTANKQKLLPYKHNDQTFIKPVSLQLLKDKQKVCIIDCSVDIPQGTAEGKTAKDLYLEGHLPGAIFMDLANCRDVSSPYLHMIPPPSQLK